MANFGAAVRALENADWWWVLAALPAVFVAQGCSTLLQLGAIPSELPFRPTYAVQFGGAFLNKVTPNGVGGMALSFRYLQKTGVDSGAATGSVGLQTILSTGASLVLTAAFLAATGRKTSVHFSLPGHEWLFLVVAGALIALALFALTPPGRRLFREKVWGFLRSAGSTVAGVARSPRHVALIVIGAFGWPMVEVVAFALCVHAVGGTLPFVQVAAFTWAAVWWPVLPLYQEAWGPSRLPWWQGFRGSGCPWGGRLSCADLQVADVLVDYPSRLVRLEFGRTARLRLRTGRLRPEDRAKPFYAGRDGSSPSGA